MLLKKGDDRIQPGHFNEPLDFYRVTANRDGAGGVMNPATVALNPVFAYNLFGRVQPFGGDEAMSADRVVGENLATISIPYFSSCVPIEGMRIKQRSTGDEYEIRSVNVLDYQRRKVELTCRLVR